MCKQLGNGAYGTVYLSRHRTADKERPWSTVAIKRVRPNASDTGHGERLLWTLQHLEAQCQEIRSLRLLGGARGVVKLYEYFLDSDCYHLVTELLGMEIEQFRNSEESSEEFTEATVRDMSRTILGALSYMHSKGMLDTLLQEMQLRCCVFC
jgi:serine/threonine protein kinase